MEMPPGAGRRSSVDARNSWAHARPAQVVDAAIDVIPQFAIEVLFQTASAVFLVPPPGQQVEEPGHSSLRVRGSLVTSWS
jgi:hypothetical protein